MWARDAFGLLVRAVGLVFFFWGQYTVIYGVQAILGLFAPTGHRNESFIITAVALLLTGLLTLRFAERIVDFTYGRRREL